MSCGGNCHNSNYVNGILNRCKISNGGKNLVNNFNQRILNLENGELDLTNVSTDIIPSENEAFNLGSNEKRFKDLYLSGNTINLGGLKLSANSSGELVVTNENGEDSLNKSTKLWAQLGEDIDGEASGDNSGWSVSFSSNGTRVAIGAPDNNGVVGHTRVYEWNGTSWIQLGQDIDGEYHFPDPFNQSGYSVSLSGDGSIVAIGAPYNSRNGLFKGQVRIYEWNGSNWIQLGQDIYGEASDDRSGYSVSLSSDGTRVAIGALYANSNGTTYVYELDGNNWTQIGQDIIGEASGDNSGTSVSLSGDGTIVAIGANNNNDNGNDSGHVRVYRYSNDVWIQLGQDIDGEASGDWSGYNVSLSSDGTKVAIGARRNDGDNSNNSGHVRVYGYINESWTQLGEDIDGEASGDDSGWSVSLSADGTIVAIGAPYNDGNDTNSGHIRVYQYSSGSWTQLGQDIDGEAAYNKSGTSVSLSADGTKVAIGAPNNNLSSGQVRVFQLSNYNYNEIENLYVSNELKFKENNEIKSISDKANLESQVFTGSPEVPTQTVENNNKIVNNTMLIESVNNINESNISNSSISDTTLKGNINYEDSEGNRNPMLYLNINEVTEHTIIPNNSSGIYVNTSGNSIYLTLSSDNNEEKSLSGYSSMLVYTSSSKIYGFPSV